MGSRAHPRPPEKPALKPPWRVCLFQSSVSRKEKATAFCITRFGVWQFSLERVPYLEPVALLLALASAPSDMGLLFPVWPYESVTSSRRRSESPPSLCSHPPLQMCSVTAIPTPGASWTAPSNSTLPWPWCLDSVSTSEDKVVNRQQTEGGPPGLKGTHHPLKTARAAASPSRQFSPSLLLPHQVILIPGLPSLISRPGLWIRFTVLGNAALSPQLWHQGLCHRGESS